MFRFAFLRNIFLISLLIAFTLPVYDILVVHPKYEELLAEETESEAERFAAYLIRSLHLASLGLDRETISADILREVDLLRQDPELVKLRFFSPGGEIVFSTDPAEIGTINSHDYFILIVAQGRVFSKVVRKDTPTADGPPAAISVVETYVPIMNNGRFAGAIEIYYDITARLAKTRQLSLRSNTLLLSLAIALLAVLWLTLRQARRSIEARQQAEDALRQVNSALEERVAERTGELLQVNQKLSAEITERTEAQAALGRALQALEEDKKRIDGIVRSVAEGLVVTDDEGGLVLLNPAAEEMLELEGKWQLGAALSPLIEDPRVREGLEELLAAAAGASREFELSRSDSPSPAVVQARTSAARDSSGRPAGRITVLHDITYARTVERLKSEFISMAAHELQTPLTAIIGYSELLLSEEAQFSPEDRKEFLLYVYDKAEALGRIVRDLLDISRVEAGRLMPLEKDLFPLADLLEKMANQYRKRHPRHQFEVRLLDEGEQVEADRSRLAQVLENLLSNAVKYSPGGVVRITGRRADGFYQISVADQGIGMTGEQLARVFDKFYRVDNSNTAAPGIGLGMSIARYMVEAHGGRIWVESEVGRGTTVHFTLPLPLPGQRAPAVENKITDAFSDW